MAVGQLAAGVAHEIRNPLASLKGFIQLMKTPEEGLLVKDQYLEIMNDELIQIENFVNKLSVLAKQQVKSYQSTDITLLLQSTITLLESHAILNHVHIEFEPKRLPKVWCEEKQIKQVFFNIIQNAIEAMPNGGILYIKIQQQDQSLLNLTVQKVESTFILDLHLPKREVRRGLSPIATFRK